MDINGIVPMTLEQFFAIPSGSHVYNYGNDQCVALANLYDEGVLKYPLPNGINSAFQWWTTYSQKPELYNYFDQVSANPQRGDIFVSRGGVYDSIHGHIGIVERSWDGSTFGTMENGYWNGTSCMKRFNRNMANVLGFLRTKSAPTPAPTPIPELEGLQMANIYINTSNGQNVLMNPETGFEWVIPTPAYKDLVKAMGLVDKEIHATPEQMGFLRQIANTCHCSNK